MSFAQRMALPALWAPLLVPWAGCSAGEGPARSALLITLEATRRDALGAYGAAPSVTPHLDDLAEEAIRYEWARSVAPLSRPAHASIATGLYPPRHGLRSERSQALADRAVTVAERARAAGFATAAFLGSRALDESSGLLQGFEHHGAPPPGDPTFGDVPKRPAAEVVGEATAWLQERPRERPFFLWVHCSDARRPRHGTDAPETAAYLEEVGAIDRALGELFAVLAAEDLLEETFVAVAGASGEALGEHGELGAGLELWDSTLRVPLLLRYHDGFGAGEASSEIVSVADLAPTLLEAMGLESRGSGDLDGTSLYYQSVATDRGVYFESYDGWERFGWSPLVGVADARGKLVRGARDELFDPRRDPLELAPVAVGEPERYDGWLRAARAEPVIAGADLAGPGGPSGGEASILAELEALGYASPAAAARYPLPEELAGRRDPRDTLAEHETLERARDLVRSGDFEAALPLLEDLRRANPSAPVVLDALAAALLGLERHARAVEVLRTRLGHAPERMETHRDLRICFTALGDEEHARAHSIRALELQAEHHQRGRDLEALRRTRMLLDHTRRAAAAELGTGAGAPAGGS